MSIEEKIQEVVPPGQPLQDTNDPDLPVAPTPQGSQLKCGYVVGIREDNTLVFEVLGSKPGIIELIGLHKIAWRRIEDKVASKLRVLEGKE